MNAISIASEARSQCANSVLTGLANTMLSGQDVISSQLQRADNQTVPFEN